MATIERIGKLPINTFRGLSMDSIENEHKTLNKKHFVSSVDETLKSFEYDRTFNKIKVLQGLYISSIENANKKLYKRHLIIPIKEDLNSFTHDRTFNNVDVIEGMYIHKLENPNSKFKAISKIYRIIPLKSYDNKINCYCSYDNNLKY